MRRITLAASAAVLTVLVVVLTACGPGTPPKPSESPKPSATATATPTPTPSADPEPEVAITCETIVSPATIAGFAADGVSITPPADFRAKLINEGNALAAIFDAGGVVCQTGAGAGAFEIYAYGVMSSAQFAPLRSQFVADGHVEQVTDAGVVYTVPNDMEGLPRVCYFRADAFLACGNTNDRINEIVDILGVG
jgi:hypothetical protein